MFKPITSEILSLLTAVVGPDGLSTAQADLDLHAKDQSHHDAHPAEAVIWPETAEQVSAIMQLANAHHIPVTSWGMGTSLEGNPIPLQRGIVLSFLKMNKIIAIHADDFQVTVQAGMGYKDLNEQLARQGLFFPPDPGANASIGGMLANNASGIRTVKYGACKDNVLKMQVVLADGRIIDVGSRSVKQSAGYDLLHLFVGSEGTLGVITQATLKLTPIAEYMSAAVASFPTVEAAVETVVAIRGSGLDPAALEFIDAENARMLNTVDGVDLGDTPALFMEFHAAHEETLAMGLEMVREICEEMGATRFRATTDATERRQLWYARHHMFEIAVRLNPGKKFVLMDVAVPISAYPELIAYARQSMDGHQAQGFMIGHAGDGNIHIGLPFASPEGYALAQKVNGDVVRKAIALGGTATGEHGVGIGKAPYMVDEHGPALDVMRALKDTLDPQGILNPGKIFA